MMKEYRTVGERGDGEYDEKKSRFLGEAVHIETEADADAYLQQVRKKYYDARHHCFAYAAGEPGTAGEVYRFSDDGEPSGTAGKPILEVLKGKELHQTLLVVTRYFGGTLLGTGGLVRSYTNAAARAAEAAEILVKVNGIRLHIGCTYPAYGKLQYQFAQNGLVMEQAEFGESVSFDVLIPEEEEKRVRKLVQETTDGRGTCEVAEHLIYTKR